MNRIITILFWCLFLANGCYSQTTSSTKVYFFNSGLFNQIKTVLNQVIYIKLPENSITLLELDVDSLGFLVNNEVHYFHFLKGKTSFYNNYSGQFTPVAEDLFWLNAHLRSSRKIIRYEIKDKWLKQIED